MKNSGCLLVVLVVLCGSAFSWQCPKGQHWVQTPGQTNVEVGHCVSDNQAKPTSVTQNTNNNYNRAISGSKSTATAVQNQSQVQNAAASSSAAASNNGNGANNTNISSSFKEVHQTPPAYAPDAIPSAPCFKPFSGGASSPFFGAALGAGKLDKGCDARETARQFALLGNYSAAAKVLCSTDAAKAAKLTMEDCLATYHEQVVVNSAPIVLPPLPSPVIETPLQTEPEPISLVSFSSKGRLNNEDKAELDTAIIYARNHPEGKLIVCSDPAHNQHILPDISDYLENSNVNFTTVSNYTSKKDVIDILYVP